MKNQSPHRIAASCFNFLCCLLLGLCLLSLPARATIPSGLTLTDTNIGSATGGSLYDSGTDSFTVMGTGGGVWWGGSDNAHFSYTTATGDMEIVARLVSFNYPANQSMAGLTIRQSLAPGEVNRAATWFWPGYASPPTNRVSFVGWGPPVDGNTGYFASQASTPKPPLNPPYWLKLVRVGNNFGAYWSLNGKDWNFIQNQSGGALMGTGTFDIGLLVSSNNSPTLATAVFDNVYVGAPRLKYKTSWVGSTSQGKAAGRPGNNIYSMWVKPDDGTCFTNGNWTENGSPALIYKDGKLFHPFFAGVNYAHEGTVTGNASNIFYYNGIPTPGIWRSDFTTASPVQLTFTGTTLGEVRGLAASSDTLFVSDYGNGLLRRVSLATGAEIGTPISFPRCGPSVFDGTNFWVIQAATQDVAETALSTHTVGTHPTSIICYSPTGQNLSALPVGDPNRRAAITWTSPDTCIPTALAFQDLAPIGTTGANDVLWVCDNGPHQYIRKYTNLTGTPAVGTPFGVDGGIWAGSTPGKITDAASGGDKRFYGPVGVGTDTSGNIYVACNGGVGNTTDVRKFNSAGTLQWRINGLIFLNNGDFDPASDGQEYYTPDKHFTMNYANTAPGSEWSYKGYTRNIITDPVDRSYGGAKLARIGGNLYMYTHGQGFVGTSRFCYVNGETATFFGTNAMDGVAPNYHRIWIDMNTNGINDAGDLVSSAPQSQPGGVFESFDVDGAGNIWMCSQGSLTGDKGSIRQVVNQGTQTLTNGKVVPKYSLNAGGYNDYLIPSPLATGVQINYDSLTDTLYLVGLKSDNNWALVRCDKWTSNPENKTNPVATWAVDLPLQTDISILLPPPVQFKYNGLDVVGGKIFVSEEFIPIHVYDAALGNQQITLIPGPEVSATSAWDDMTMGVSAFKRSTGEYLVSEENTGDGACALLYRWTPTADTAVTAAPTVLTASAPGRKILLSWNGPLGMVTSYKIYRGTASGGETLYQSGLTSPTFTDLNVTAGTTYYYKVTAVNAAGESVLSNEASASPVSSQAEFVKTDTTTQGNWTTTSGKIYGKDGYEICNYGAPTYPSYATVSIAPATILGTWANPTLDVRALLKDPTASSPDRIAAYRTQAAPGILWNWNVNITDGKWHQVAVYMLDWPTGLQKRTTHVVKVVDAATSRVLDTRFLGDFTQGKYLVWNLTGNVKIEISNTIPTTDPVASGLFFDPVQVAPPTVAWWKLDDTTNTTVTDSSGAGNYATKVGGTWTAGAHSVPASGNFLGCLTFGGTAATSNLSLPSVIFNLPQMAFSMWFKTSTSGVLLGMQNLPSSPTVIAPVLYVGTDNKLHGAFNTGVIQTITSAATVNDNAWHHAALTSNGLIQTLYLDGEVAGMQVAPVTMLVYAWCGQGRVTGWPYTTGTQMFFTGLVDDIRLYNRVLTTAEIWKLKNP